MTLFKILWGFDALGSLIILFFFFAGLADGTVNSRNGGLWTIIVLAITAVMGGSVWLKRAGYILPSYLVLCVIALPAIAFLGYFLIVLMNGKSAWR